MSHEEKIRELVEEIIRLENAFRRVFPESIIRKQRFRRNPSGRTLAYSTLHKGRRVLRFRPKIIPSHYCLNDTELRRSNALGAYVVKR